MGQPKDWNEGLIVYYNALRLADEHGFVGVRLLSHRQDAINSCDEIALGIKKFCRCQLMFGRRRFRPICR